MTQKSILDYDEAAQRLLQMEQDQAILIELVPKLKNLLRDAETKTQGVQDRIAVAGTKLAAAEELVASLTAARDDLLGQTTAAFASIEQLQTAIKQETNQLIQQIDAHSDKIAANLNAQHAQWVDRQQSFLNDFRTRHLQMMDELSKSYDRQKIVFDSIGLTVKSLESEQAQLSSEVRRRVEEESVQARKMIDSALSSLNSATDERLSKAQQGIADELRAIRDEHDTLTRVVNKQSHSIKRRIFAIWAFGLLFIVLAAYFGWQATRGNVGSMSETVPKVITKPSRLWMDKTGQYTVDATLEGSANGVVQLKKMDGRIIDIPLERLSDGDVKHVQESLRPTPKR